MFECIRLFNINRKKTESVDSTDRRNRFWLHKDLSSVLPLPTIHARLSSSFTKWLTFASVTHFILGTFIGPVPHPLSSKPSTLLSKRPELPVSCNPRPELVICISCLKCIVSPEMTVSCNQLVSIENYQLLRSFSLISLNALVSIICQSCTTVSFLSAPYPMCSGENLN